MLVYHSLEEEKSLIISSHYDIIGHLPVEQHGNKLNDNDGKEEEHEHDTNGLKMKILFGNQDLGR